MNSLEEEVCWAWLRLQTELNNQNPNAQLLDSLIYLHNESFNEWIKANNVPTNFKVRLSRQTLSYCDSLRCYQVSIKKLNDELDSRLTNLNNININKIIGWLEKLSNFTLYIVTFGVLGSRWE
jgi:hypothetical protein